MFDAVIIKMFNQDVHRALQEKVEVPVLHAEIQADAPRQAVVPRPRTTAARVQMLDAASRCLRLRTAAATVFFARSLSSIG
jgi:hypothetical protein